jgi:acyl-CoA thioesterase-1
MQASRTVLPVLLVVMLGTLTVCAPAPVHAATTATASPVMPAAHPPLRVLFVGASVTEGWFASTPSRAYPAVVVHGLTAGRHRVRKRVMAVPGATAETAATWALDVPSDLVVVQLATNDYVRATPVAVFSASYAEVLRRIRAASPHADLVCLGGWDDPSVPNRIGVTAREYDAVAWSACESQGGDYVDLSPMFMDPRNHGPVGRSTYAGPGDLFHPNDRGHEALAAAVLGSL